MTRVILLLGLVALTLWALLDIGQTPPRQVAVLPKPLWLVVALIPGIGPALWFLGGRLKTPVSEPASRRPLGPDDDPDFLRGLGG